MRSVYHHHIVVSTRYELIVIVVVVILIGQDAAGILRHQNIRVVESFSCICVFVNH